MVFRAEPLLHEHGDEKGRQGKVYALGAERQHRAQEGAQEGAQYPIHVVQRRHQDVEALFLLTGQLRGIAHQGIGLVGEGEDKVGLGLAGVLVPVDHGQAVKHMAHIHHQRGESHGEEAGGAAHQLHRHELHGPGIYKGAHGRRPQGPVAPALQHHPEAQADDQVAGEHRHRGHEGFFQNILFHSRPSLFRTGNI